jgi:hypothetical protein
MQVMPKAQLPILVSIIMVIQAVLAAPSGLQAKKSIKDRNMVLLVGYAAIIAANAAFAMIPSIQGVPQRQCPCRQRMDFHCRKLSR